MGMIEEMKACPQCKCPYGYSTGVAKYECPECNHQWLIEQFVDVEELKVKDANGNLLCEGDDVVLAKNLPVKGTSSSIKVGTKVKNIRLVDGDHNIDCKIKGFGSVGLKSEFVKKAK
jgi:protein PhnA